MGELRQIAGSNPATPIATVVVGRQDPHRQGFRPRGVCHHTTQCRDIHRKASNVACLRAKRRTRLVPRREMISDDAKHPPQAESGVGINVSEIRDEYFSLRTSVGQHVSVTIHQERAARNLFCAKQISRSKNLLFI